MSAETSGDHDMMEQLTRELAERRRRGESPTPQEYLARYPHLAAEVHKLFGAAAPTTPPAEQLGDYRIVRELGRGGMGVVYEAEQLSLGRHVALKVLPAHAGRDGHARERFRREARAAARLHHTNIVPVFEVGQEGDFWYYAMQLIQGHSLDRLIHELRCLRDQPPPPGGGADPAATLVDPARRAAEALLTGAFQPESLAGSPSPMPVENPTIPLPHTEMFREALAEADRPSAVPQPLAPAPTRARPYFINVARIGQQAAAALAYAHARGIIHRDIKPANLMLDAAGVVWVTDFGLAKGEDEDLTNTGDLVGTFRYMAPERFHGRGDGRADVYGLGLTLYELLVLRPAFAARDRAQLIEQVRSQEPARPRALDRRVPRDLETIILKAIARDPDRRYQTAEDLAEDLRRFAADEPIRARRATLAERAWRWCRHNPALASLTTLVALLLTVLAIGSSLSAWSLQEERERVLDERRRADQAEHQRRLDLVKSLSTAAPDSVPYILEDMQGYRDLALPVLRDKLADPATTHAQKLRVAIALTLLGEPQPELLVEGVATASAAEARNLTAALARVRASVTEALQQRAVREKEPARRNRLVATLLYLGDAGAAGQILRGAGDATGRVAFIHDLPAWRADLSALPAILRGSVDADLRSGLCAALGRLDPETLTAAERQGLEEVFRELFVRAPDGGTHSAAGWALRQWHSPLPALPTGSAPAEGRHWFLNRHGLTMLAIKPGVFAWGDAPPALRPPRAVLTRPFFMCDRETPLSLFQEFMADRAYPADRKPQGWPGPNPASPTADCPVGNVSWQDALLFCNWLSVGEGRRPCYHRQQDGRWRCDFQADGYRLPTDAEWEYCYRAGTTTRFPVGAEPDRLLAYGNVELMRTIPGASRQPSPWGLFDMTGNVWEHCWDALGPLPTTLVLDPVGPEGGWERVCRGGGFGGGPYYARAGLRFAVVPDGRNSDGSMGFRVVCGHRKPDPPAGPLVALVEEEAGVLSLLPATRPQAAALWQQCARWRLALRAWAPAAADLRWALALKQDDHDQWYHLAPLLLQAGDVDGYRRHRQALLARFAKTTDPVTAERTAKACLLLPGTAAEEAAATRLAALAVRDGQRLSPRNYFELALGLAEYRAGRLAEADQRLSGVLARDSVSWNLVVPTRLVLAMARQRQGKKGEAREALAAALRFMEKQMPAQLDAGGDWHDWLICHLLRHEAEALLNGGPVGGQSRRP
jgi:formylglycine-generating enzyme required for sulfatase activity